ncbi:hypothetical protein L2821_09875 [Lactobacillus gasseri]|nr:hypothetical protein [Lactobacillus gasseri]MCZ3555297.1 hypothetical protein [Lactobacillus gasseri]
MVEKDVEDAWREFFTTCFVKNKTDANDDFTISSPENVDGLIMSDNIVFALKLLLEFKKDTNLNKVYDRARITAQCIHYMRLLSDNDRIRPNVICGADQSKAFVLYAPNFYDYLKHNYNWKCRPSDAYRQDPQLMKDLITDRNLSVWVYEFDYRKPKQAYINLQELIDEIDKLAQTNGNQYQVKVTDANITGMFSEFKRIVFNNPDEVTARESVTIFMKLLIGDNTDYYLHPNKFNVLHLPNGKEISVDAIALKAFFKHFNRQLKPKEQDRLLSIADRLIEDETRRRKGDFWTPTIWANEADKLLQDAFGKDYKENSIVWDCAAGTKNLTRDFVYSDLYSSTIYQSEVDLGEKYNPEAKESFQYDFLNDDIDLNPESNGEKWKLPKTLFIALKEAAKTNERVIFYTNPPYGTANNLKKYGTSKSNIAQSKINAYMKKNDYGSAAQQLYAQFFVRVIKIVNDFHLKNVGIGFFTNARFFAGGNYWQKFNNKFFSKFKFIKGTMLNAGEFSDTSNTWPIVFATYKYQVGGGDVPAIDKVSFALKKSAWDEEKGELLIESVNKKIKNKTMLQVYKPNDLSSWVRETLPPKPSYCLDTYPQLSGALVESKGKRPSGKLLKNSLGYMVFNSDNIGEGTTNGGVWIASSSAYKGHGINVLPENFKRVVVGFAARRAVKPTWYNAQDNYVRPDINNSKYDEFVNDSLIYSLFDNASYQAAYRNWKNYSNLANFKNKWANQWFWLDIDTVRELTNEYNQMQLYNDTRGDTNRYVAKMVNQTTFSPEAKAVLDIVNKIWLQTLSCRQSAILANETLSLEAWDAGWFQLKQLVKLFPDKNQILMLEFKEKFEILKKKIEDEVYDLNMLSR